MTSTASPRTPRSRSLRVGVFALAVALGAALAGCGGGADTPAKPPEPQSMKGGQRLAARWPLTGLPARGDTPRHPVLAVKVPNTPDSYPQVGLSKADLVAEELVEGGITRLAVLYYQHVPRLVGPVRSMRASDMGIVKPADAVLVSSGAAPTTLRELRANHIPYLTGGDGYFRDSSAPPYNLMVRLPAVARSVRKKAQVPPPYLPWGSEGEFSGAQGARSIQVRFSGGHTTSWRYAGGKYHNTGSYAPANDRFEPDSVLVLRVHEGNAGYLDPAGNPVPKTILSGSGPALLFHRGKLVRGTWHKAGMGRTLSLRTRAGELKVPAGRVWIELTPVDAAGGRVSWQRK